MKCLFCQDNNAYIISEKKFARGYKFSERFNESHFVVAPKRHVFHFTDLTKDEIVDIFEIAKDIALKEKKKYPDIEKYYIMTIVDNGDHIHFHFMPKTKSMNKLSQYIFGNQGWTNYA